MIFLLITSLICALSAGVCLFVFIVGKHYDREWIGVWIKGFVICLQLAAIGVYLLWGVA